MSGQIEHKSVMTMIAVYIPFHMVRVDQYLRTDCACDTVFP